MGATPTPATTPPAPFQDDGAKTADGDEADAVPEAQDTVQVIPGSQLLWRVNSRPPNSAQVSASSPRPCQCLPPLSLCHLVGLRFCRVSP